MTPRQLPPDTRYPLIIGGVAQGNIATVFGTKLIARAVYEIVVNKTGTRTNGINITGFNTIGNAKIICSFILNKPAGDENFATSRYGCFFSARITMKIAIIKETVVPAPPIKTYVSKNGLVIIFGTSNGDTPFFQS